MNQIFFRILNMSIMASLLSIVVILLRLLFKRVPKWIICLLWAIVALRLIIPFNIESPVSLMPEQIANGTYVQGIVGDEQYAESSPVQLSETAVSVEHSETGTFVPESREPQSEIISSGQKTSFTKWLKNHLWMMWAFGAGIMILYACFSFIRLKLRLNASVRVNDVSGHIQVYANDDIVSPFLLGIIRPVIYMPSTLCTDTDSNAFRYVLKHEQAHVSRWDHIWKPLGFLLLSINWFNPLLWVAYILLCRDIEAACDEKVIKGLDLAERADYSRTLLALSSPRREIAACPVAFGETGTKSRIKAVLNYKKPAFWIIIAAIAICVVAGVCLLTIRPGTDNNHETEITIPKGSSIWTAVNSIADYDYKPTISFGTDEETAELRFMLSYDPLSSYLSFGQAVISNDRIVCSTDDCNYTYVFVANIDDGYISLVFDAASSTVPNNFTQIIPDGTEFEFSGEVESESSWEFETNNKILLTEDDIGLQRWNYAAQKDQRLANLKPIAIIGSRNIGLGIDPSDTSKFAYLAFSPTEDEYPAGWRIVVLEVSEPMVTAYNYLSNQILYTLNDGQTTDTDWEFGLNTTAVSASEHFTTDELKKLSMADSLAQTVFDRIRDDLPEEMYPVALLQVSKTDDIDYQILCATDASESNGDIYVVQLTLSQDGEFGITSCDRLNMSAYINVWQLDATSLAAESPNENDEKGFVFVYEGHEFYMGMPEEEIQQYKKDYYAVPYGISTGHRYEFDHFYIDCVPGDLGGGPTLAEMMSFKDASCGTSEGIRIGDSLDQVIDAYKGNDLLIKSYHNYQYWKGNSTLSFDIEDGIVSGISYYYTPGNYADVQLPYYTEDNIDNYNILSTFSIWAVSASRPGPDMDPLTYRPFLSFSNFDDAEKTASFIISYDPLRSYVHSGRAEFFDDKVVCRVDDGGPDTFVFLIKREDTRLTLVFSAADSYASADFKSVIPDGTEFGFTRHYPTNLYIDDTVRMRQYMEGPFFYKWHYILAFIPDYNADNAEELLISVIDHPSWHYYDEWFNRWGSNELPEYNVENFMLNMFHVSEEGFASAKEYVRSLGVSYYHDGFYTSHPSGAPAIPVSGDRYWILDDLIYESGKWIIIYQAHDLFSSDSQNLVTKKAIMEPHLELDGTISWTMYSLETIGD